jgi:C4-type Zn-finger protein
MVVGKHGIRTFKAMVVAFDVAFDVLSSQVRIPYFSGQMVRTNICNCQFKL